jgi:tetratricopeptide (TPR) repeat protein
MAADPNAAMLQAALALQQQGNLKEARRKYESIIARDPRNFNALQLCGVVAMQQEAYRDAIKLIRRALALRGNDAPGSPILALPIKSWGKRRKRWRVLTRPSPPGRISPARITIAPIYCVKPNVILRLGKATIMPWPCSQITPLFMPITQRCSMIFMSKTQR